MSDKPPPDKTLFIARTNPGDPVEINWVSRQIYDTGTNPPSMTVVLTEGAPEGYAAEVAEALRAAFPGVYVTVL